MAVLNDCVCQHVGYCDGSCQHPLSMNIGKEALTEALFAELGEPDHKVARWSQGAEPWHYWSRERIADALACVLTSSTSSGVTEEQTLATVAECVKEYAEQGFWRSCSGCHELNEGVPTGRYSKSFACHLGLGCSECGGIGAIWDTTNYAEMALEASRSPVSQEEAVPVAEDLRAEVLRLFKANGMENDERLAIIIAEYFALRSPAVEGK